VCEGEEGKIEGRYEEEQRPLLHPFEVPIRSNCVFSYTFGKTDPKKDEGWKDEGCYVFS
jgi:hypothetical protein